METAPSGFKGDSSGISSLESSSNTGSSLPVIAALICSFKRSCIFCVASRSSFGFGKFVPSNPSGTSNVGTAYKPRVASQSVFSRENLAHTAAGHVGHCAVTFSVSSLAPDFVTQNLHPCASWQPGNNRSAHFMSRNICLPTA